MARRALRPEEDTNHNGLPDEWEMFYFGSLKYGKYDDPDGDSFPNIVEWYRGTDPTKIDLLDPRLKPQDLRPRPVPTSPWDLQWEIHDTEFWATQAEAAESLR